MEIEFPEFWLIFFVNKFGAGQFIVSIEQCIQLVDFESVESDQPVRVVVINPNDTVSTRRGTINEVIHGISFSNTTVPHDKVRPHSTIVHSTETERCVPPTESILRILILRQNYICPRKTEHHERQSNC